MTPATKSPLELAITPHPARAGWHVLRVNYPDEPEARTRVREAVARLLDGSAALEPVPSTPEGDSNAISA